MINSICAVPGIKVGHAQNEEARTGCTVILPENPAVPGIDVRGSAPGSRETDLLAPHRTVQEVHAIVLTGGSAFGLDSACGVVKYLEEKGIGYDTGVAKVPIVPAAVIYDLGVGSAQIRPDAEMGYRAAQQATRENADQGSVGVGTGATVGKFAGIDFAMQGGVGTCADVIDDEIYVGVLVVVNSLGNIINPGTGQTIAGARKPDGEFFDPLLLLKKPQLTSFSQLTNTTLAVVATNACLTKAEATQLAQLATAGITRTTLPAHTPYDGDVVFVLSTRQKTKIDLIRLGAIAADLVAKAIVSAVQISNSQG